jgi:translation initiation factor IF-1
MSDDVITMTGVVVEQHRGDIYVVDCQLGALRRRVLAKRSGRLNVHKIRVIPGDIVEVEVSPYSLDRGRIVYRGNRDRVA